MIRPQTKISKAQYKALLQRTLDRQDVEDNQSQMMQMQQMLGGMQGYGAGMQPGQPPIQPGMEEQGAMPPPQASQAPVDPMMQAAPPNPSVMPTAAGQQPPEVLAQAAIEVWKELQGTLGEQLWSRFTGGVNPAESFIQAAVKFMQDPNSVPDERMKQFLSGVLPQEALAPAASGQQSNPLMDTILSTMR